jgi:hypothetical protein
MSDIKETTKLKYRFENFGGILFSIVVTAGFIWATVQLYTLWKDPNQTIAQNIKVNEIQTFLNLQTISQAQKKYKEKDWDGDGKKTYAKYFIHLWTSVSLSGDSIYVGLVPGKLAFAIEPARAINGYYFVDLHDRFFPTNNETQRLDYESQWAVLATTPADGQTEKLYFLADNSGGIFVKPAKYISPQYIDDPVSNGWTKIDSIQQLRDYQKKIIYPQIIPQK